RRFAGLGGDSGVALLKRRCRSDARLLQAQRRSVELVVERGAECTADESDDQRQGSHRRPGPTGDPARGHLSLRARHRKRLVRRRLVRGRRLVRRRLVRGGLVRRGLVRRGIGVLRLLRGACEARGVVGHGAIFSRTTLSRAEVVVEGVDEGAAGTGRVSAEADGGTMLVTGPRRSICGALAGAAPRAITPTTAMPRALPPRATRCRVRTTGGDGTAPPPGRPIGAPARND